MTDILESKSPLKQIAYTPIEAAAATGRTRTRIFKAIKDKELTARKDGRSTLIETDELARWVRSLPTIGRNADEPAEAAATDAQGTGKGSAGAEAEELLRNALATGPVAMKDIQAEAKEAGLSWATVRRAKERLGIVAERESHGRDGDRRWMWAMPRSARCSSSLQDAHPLEVSTLQESEHLADQAKAPIGIVPADDLDIPDSLDRRPALGSGGRP
jgi:excisionase family DNA binding protein